MGITSIRVVGAGVVEVGDCVAVGVGTATGVGRPGLVGAAVAGIRNTVTVSVGVGGNGRVCGPVARPPAVDHRVHEWRHCDPGKDHRCRGAVEGSGKVKVLRGTVTSCTQNADGGASRNAARCRNR